MNKLVLIGNGFDLAHGLKTSYTDFLVWYLNKASYKMCDNMFYEDELISYKTSFRVKYEEIKSITDFLNFQEQQLIKGHIKYKHDFFPKLIRNLSIQNWVDIEYRYYLSVLEVMNKRGFESKGLEYEDALENLRKLNLSFETLKNELVEYLKTIDTAGKKDNKIVDNFEKYICEIDKKGHNNKLFLNFNYTSTLLNYWDMFKTPPGKEGKRDANLINIHGTIDDEKNPIIFGYGDDMDTHYAVIENLNEKEFLKNMKKYWYHKTSNFQKFKSFINSENYEVYIFGHSCGISDRVMLNRIFDHENCKSIRIFYYMKDNSYNDHFEKTQEITKHFKPENRQRIEDLIVPFDQSCPLS
ncbi:MAG: AbiH family protein [Candidatus Delongbacteria bacterium]|nr:AbiH family protein [Candidatus Delongbacteria bacterium]